MSGNGFRRIGQGLPEHEVCLYGASPAVLEATHINNLG